MLLEMGPGIAISEPHFYSNII